MFGKKKAKKLASIAEVSARLRGFVLDSQIQDGHELSVILGCSAMSDELQQREEEESDKRVAKIEHLVPLLYAYAHSLAEGAIELQKQSVPEELKGLPEEIWWESRKMMEQVSLSALLGSISQLVDMGLVAIPKRKR